MKKGRLGSSVMHPHKAVVAAAKPAVADLEIFTWGRRRFGTADKRVAVRITFGC
jgi:hypothetical protein